jgi:RNA polymerase sigma-70 factor, ECF subfamily
MGKRKEDLRDQSPPPGGLSEVTSQVRNQPDFETFFLTYEQPLYGYLRRMLTSEEEARELAQETFFRAWQQFDRISTYRQPHAWLYQVATHLALNQLRKQRLRSSFRWFHREDEASAEEQLAHPLDLEGQTVERDLIAKVLRQLPPRQRATLLLRAVHGFSAEEIAGLLESNPAAVRKNLCRARAQFRLFYEAAQGTATDPESAIDGDTKRLETTRASHKGE